MTAQTDDEHLTAHLPEPAFVPLPDYRRYPEAEVLARGEAGYAEMNRRRTTRQFWSEALPRRLIELALLSAGTALSGAHRQPWRFVAMTSPPSRPGCALRPKSKS